MEQFEEHLLQQCQKGRPAAQKALYEQYKTTLFPVCLRYARDHAEAEDLLQEAFIVIFRDIRHFRGDGSLEGWLRRVTVRVSLMQLRKKHPVRFAEPFDLLPPEQSVELPADSDLNAQELLALMQKMPDGYRTVFNLRCVEEYSYEEIAETMGIAESSARSQYARACRFMRGLVERMLGAVGSGR